MNDTAIVDAEFTAPPIAGVVADGCSHCGSKLSPGSRVCTDCGYYETIGQFVEIEKPEEEEAIRIPYELALIPIVCLSIFAESVVSVFFTHQESPDRFQWSAAHLIIGLLLFVIPHLRAQYLSFRENELATGFFGFIFTPLKIWKVVVAKLPKSLPWILSACAGLTSILCSLLVIQGLPSPFSTWTPEVKKTRVSISVPTGGGDRSMKEAIEELQQVEITKVKVEQVVDDRERVYEDCVIIGYKLSESKTRVQSLVLAAQFEGFVKVVGTVSEGINELTRVKLATRLSKLQAPQPLIANPYEATWVQPTVFCRIWFHETEDGDRDSVTFDRVLLLK